MRDAFTRYGPPSAATTSGVSESVAKLEKQLDITFASGLACTPQHDAAFQPTQGVYFARAIAFLAHQSDVGE
jgi:hypothetical protein